MSKCCNCVSEQLFADAIIPCTHELAPLTSFEGSRNLIFIIKLFLS